eukprot:GHVL01010650.1.p1 GENE.GHVL01010650.1~~GHVL01010650.1.p1  ORF type:complete len:694 (-),score=89.10 GHVL01010650.1:30-2111(-)
MQQSSNFRSRQPPFSTNGQIEPSSSYRQYDSRNGTTTRAVTSRISPAMVSNNNFSRGRREHNDYFVDNKQNTGQISNVHQPYKICENNSKTNGYNGMPPPIKTLDPRFRDDKHNSLIGRPGHIQHSTINGSTINGSTINSQLQSRRLSETKHRNPLPNQLRRSVVFHDPNEAYFLGSIYKSDTTRATHNMCSPKIEPTKSNKYESGMTENNTYSSKEPRVPNDMKKSHVQPNRVFNDMKSVNKSVFAPVAESKNSYKPESLETPKGLIASRRYTYTSDNMTTGNIIHGQVALRKYSYTPDSMTRENIIRGPIAPLKCMYKPEVMTAESIIYEPIAQQRSSYAPQGITTDNIIHGPMPQQRCSYAPQVMTTDNIIHWPMPQQRCSYAPEGITTENMIHGPVAQRRCSYAPEGITTENMIHGPVAQRRCSYAPDPITARNIVHGPMAVRKFSYAPETVVATSIVGQNGYVAPANEMYMCDPAQLSYIPSTGMTAALTYGRSGPSKFQNQAAASLRACHAQNNHVYGEPIGAHRNHVPMDMYDNNLACNNMYEMPQYPHAWLPPMRDYNAYYCHDFPSYGPMNWAQDEMCICPVHGRRITQPPPFYQSPCLPQDYFGMAMPPMAIPPMAMPPPPVFGIKMVPPQCYNMQMPYPPVFGPAVGYSEKEDFEVIEEKRFVEKSTSTAGKEIRSYSQYSD